MSGIPVHLVAGFLGAGKTTTIRSWLESRKGEQVALIVNDFGEAGFDEVTLSAETPFEIKNIPGACICCTAPEGFVEALGAVLDQSPDRLIIEPTGLARPQDLIDTIRRSPHQERVDLAPLVVLVDPAQLDSASEASRELLREQAEAADVLVANRVDLAEAADLERFESWSSELWPGPMAVYRTSFGRLPEEALQWPEGQGGRAASGRAQVSSEGHDHAEHAHDSTKGFAARSWRWSADEVFSYARLQAALAKTLAGTEGASLARFKGIFQTQEGTSLLEIAGGVLHDRLTSYRRDSRADVILEGGGDRDLEAVGNWLEEARLAPEERDLPADRIQISSSNGEARLVQRERLAELPGGIDDVGRIFPKRAGAAAAMDALWSELDLPDSGSAVVVASDGFASEPIPVPGLRAGYLLHSLEGDALPPGKGGPFRLLIPEGTEGVPSSCANVKGVVKIVLRD